MNIRILFYFESLNLLLKLLEYYLALSNQIMVDIEIESTHSLNDLYCANFKNSTISPNLMMLYYN